MNKMNDMKLRSKNTLGAIFCVIFIYVFWPSPYERNIEKAYEIKNSNRGIVIFDGIKEPDIPNMSINDQSLFGIDQNNNKIRDDIEIWINRVALNYNERMMMRQYASDLEYRLNALKTKDNDIISHAESSKYTTSYCIDFIIGRIKGKELRQTMQMMVYNTFTRKRLSKEISNYNYVYEVTVKDMKMGEDYRACRFELEGKDALIKIDLERGDE